MNGKVSTSKSMNKHLQPRYDSMIRANRAPLMGPGRLSQDFVTVILALWHKKHVTKDGELLELVEENLQGLGRVMTIVIDKISSKIIN